VSLLSVEIMGIDASTTASREPVASRDTALACLVQLGAQNGLDPAVATRPRDVPDGDSLSISGLIELAGEFGYRAEDSRVDWQGLQTIGFADPILVLLKNTNVVILTGGGRDDAEEVAVWDPLHRDSEVLFVPRPEFERAWSGDVLRLTRPPSSTPVPQPDLRSVTAKDAPDTVRQQPSPSGQRPPPLMRICLVAVAIVATVGVGLFLFVRTAADHFGPTSASVGEASERIAEATRPMAGAAVERSPDRQAVSATSGSALPTANAPQSSAADAAPTPSEERMPAGGDRMAALPPAPASTGQMPVLEPPLAGATSVVPPAPGEPGPETDSTAATSAPIVPPADATLSAAEVSVLLTRGDKSFSSGDVASARLFYGRAANAGDGQAALRLGETFDPVFLDHAHLRSARGDLSAALSWYRRARDMGIGEAAVLLDSLEAK
jgi:hypothetical protein